MAFLNELLAVAFLLAIVQGNQPPRLSPDSAGQETTLLLSEATEPGTVVTTLHGEDPEGSPVHYGLRGSDRFEVSRDTGQIRLVRPLDREVNESLLFVVTLEDEVGPGLTNNVLEIPFTIIILDENDNHPDFKDVPYEATVPEDTPIGTTIFHGIRVEDPDQAGEALELACSKQGSTESQHGCEFFDVVTLNSSSKSLTGAVVLKQTLDYAKQHFHQVVLNATDGEHESSTVLEVKVGDVQNTPPEFLGSLTGVVQEDAPIGTLVMTIMARDGDRGQPRNIVYELVTNPWDYFLLDPKNGELRTAKPLDKEALDDTTGVITIDVRARELVDGVPANDPLSVSTAKATVTIKDVNDEAPTFNSRELSVVVPENVPDGTPLPLHLVVKDPDVGTNSVFSLHLKDVPIDGAFTVEPIMATGSTSVSIRVANGSLDYENPNQRKFIILVVAEELHTFPRLSSTATVTVSVADANDNVPTFESVTYSASVVETASPGTVVKTVTARDRDSGNFGENGLLYELEGTGAEKFNVNNKTGVITVADCPTPGSGDCLDYETKHLYYLSYKATDDDGKGQSTVVSLEVSLLDSNDNPPVFNSQSYRTRIDENAKKFDPPLQVQAKDADKTSEITYSIVEGNEHNLFSIKPQSGEITVTNPRGLDMTNISSDLITLIVQASDGTFSSSVPVEISVSDVNNNHPVFSRQSYLALIQEDAEIGTSVEQVTATDADSGVNAQIKYRIQKGTFDDFSIDEETGIVKIVKQLDYDRGNVYNIEVIAVDGGSPSLTGTTTLTVSVLNSNDKDPYFSPSTQRAEVSENAVPGTVFYTLVAKDPDVNETDALIFAETEPITAVDKNGKQVEDSDAFKGFFHVDRLTGNVSVMKTLQRDIAAIVRVTVLVTDITARTVQQGKGILVITIIDMNDFPPTFAKPWTLENPNYYIDLLEEQPLGSIVGTYVATDIDSNIAGYVLEPDSEYFEINNLTGVVRTKKRIDYEATKMLNFTVVAYDSGIPQMSATAHITVNVVNINDMDPVFSEPMYEVTIPENSPIGTLVVKVSATDGDEGVIGSVTYSLVGEHSSNFTVDHVTGEVRVANPTLLDREMLAEVTIQVMASDGAPPETRRTVAVPIRIKLSDVNDNAPQFEQKNYPALIVENLSLSPPAPIVQVRADDPDQGMNGSVHYSIISGNQGDVFSLDPESGILYPAASLVGQPREFHLVVEGRDGGGAGELFDTATVNISILDVNQHKPVFVMPAHPNATVEVPENAGLPTYLIMTVKATDRDPGENGRVSYHLKVNNQNTQETDEFEINADTGELRSKIIFDREVKSKYELVLVAKDHGSPNPSETLHLLTVLLVDSDDNKPVFPVEKGTIHRFRVAENAQPNLMIGKVQAIDKDEGKFARIYYYIIKGNEDSYFYIDKTEGMIYTNTSFDREKRDVYNLTIKATNNPDYYSSKEDSESMEETDGYFSVTQVQVTILDENDNAPQFEHAHYYAGVNSVADINEFVAKLSATDPDLGNNGTVSYYIAASNLFKYGSNRSSGSIIPSPFNISGDGKLVTANYMAEYNQDRFELDVVAKEKAYPEREAVTKVHVWIFEPSQLIRVILSRPPEEVNQEREKIIAELSNVTRCLVVVDDIRYHVDSAGQRHHDWCDMYLHVVDGESQTIVAIPEVLSVIDDNYDFLKDYYAGFAIENVVPAFVGIQEEAFDPALAALIALVIVLFVGCITLIVVCCCLRHWVITAPSDLKKKEALIKKEIIDDLNTTENPLWIEQKLKLYEEQELTMQVFSEPENAGLAASPQPTMDRRDSADFSQMDNTYATIQHPPARSSLNMMSGEDLADYATLSGGGIASGHSSLRGLAADMYDASQGFQGSTFQVPDPPPGSSGSRSRAGLTINKDGQPQFVAELI